MAGLTLGGALLSSFLNVLFDRMASQEVLNFFQRKKLIRKLLKELETTLLSADVLLNDAEEKQLREPNVKKWLDELKQVLYEADHVTDKINTEALRLKLERGESGSKSSKFLNFVPAMFSPFDNAVKSEIEEILVRLRYLLAQTEFLGLKKVDRRRPSHKLHAPLVEEHDVFGRKDEKEAIIKLLLSVSGHKISVIPIVGMGGVGKTTLAQLVYKERSVQERFDLKAWVTISEEFDIFKITKTILETATSRKFEIEDLHQLQNELKKALMGKKFLFVHDDVWNENYELWDLLKSSFESGAHGSKIIVTTRSKIVASKMGNVQSYELQIMSDDDCWQLFSKHVLDNTGFDVQSDLLEIGKQIVKNCKGLPLAVKSIAGLLRSVSNLEEWRTILQSDVWELQFQENQKNNIVPALWLSYHFLPRHLKPCFAYFSIFPKDYAFYKTEKEKLFLLWMAEGILQPQEGKRMEDVGEEYLNALISRSFFQRSSRDESTLFMHDLTHDLATRISGEFRFMGHKYEDSHKLRSRTRHLSYMKGVDNFMEFEGLSEAKGLRTLLSLPLSHKNIYSKPMLTEKGVHELFLTTGGCLRVLSLSQSSIIELPDSIGNLKHLRYLDVSETKVAELPSSTCTLYNLQTLLLSGCRELTQLPTNISKLINLRHLMIKDTSLNEMPQQMCNLTNLQTLSDFVLSKNDGSRIRELGALQLLHGSLCISGLENVNDEKDALEGNLRSKQYLSELILRWDGETDDSIIERGVLDALRPHVNLKELKVSGYRGTNLPNWVADPSYCNLTKISLIKFTNCCLLPSFSQLVSLRDLQIYKFDKFLGLHDEVCGSTSLTNSFQFLVTLELSQMNTWEWSFFNGGDQEGDVFPCLKRLCLNSCRKLNVGLPVGYLPSLEEFTVRKCHEMVAVFPTSPDIDAAYPSLETLQIFFCSRLKSLSFSQGLPQALTSLDIFKCPLLSPRCQRGTGEDWPKIQHVPLIRIDRKEI
ncbi:NB-ARC domain, LRR domain containing protein [Parasponia andersonii]|uniref:NB-ARC domain, LRR domain containing protein n=1 Tax=Parasponia andersonii TaxID=3476 RepID=A0A2P5AA32_PARAD|nr:NB-ARC domain, LRR domain containing protein [Parasponia andersonii]